MRTAGFKPGSHPCVTVDVLSVVWARVLANILVDKVLVIDVRTDVEIDASADVLINIFTGGAVGISIGILICVGTLVLKASAVIDFKFIVPA